MGEGVLRRDFGGVDIAFMDGRASGAREKAMFGAFERMV
jgi:hypothetical protein